MKSKYFNRNLLIMRPIATRQHKMTISDVKTIDQVLSFNASANDQEIEKLVDNVIEAKKAKKQIIWFMGSHVLRRGNSRLIIDLLKRGLITHIATNGSMVIHDFELAYCGGTLEDVEHYIQDGKFGNWQETGEWVNTAIAQGCKEGLGLGESIGKMIESNESQLPYREISVFAAAYRLNVPITVHKSIGQDITDQHPSADFSLIGEASGRDFMRFTQTLTELEGGVFLNLGSQVTGPEVYLKALSMARNLAEQKGQKIQGFTTGVFDLVDLGNWREEKDVVNFRIPSVMNNYRYYFRPLKSILIRTNKQGKSFYIQGDFSITVPSFYKSIIRRLL